MIHVLMCRPLIWVRKIEVVEVKIVNRPLPSSIRETTSRLSFGVTPKLLRGKILKITPQIP